MTWILKGTPLRIVAPDTGRTVIAAFVDSEGTARWELGAEHRLKKWPAIAKDAALYDKVLRHLKQFEVLDKVEQIIYSISVPEFDAHKWLLRTKSGEQWACDRKWWKGQSL